MILSSLWRKLLSLLCGAKHSQDSQILFFLPHTWETFLSRTEQVSSYKLHFCLIVLEKNKLHLKRPITDPLLCFHCPFFCFVKLRFFLSFSFLSPFHWSYFFSFLHQSSVFLQLFFYITIFFLSTIFWLTIAAFLHYLGKLRGFVKDAFAFLQKCQTLNF